MSSWRLVVGDSLEFMQQMEPVDAIVTSPPYVDQKHYDGTMRNKSTMSRRLRSEAPMRAAEWLRPFCEQMLDVVTDAGALMLNLGVVMRDGEESGFADQVLADCRAAGWKLLQRIIWFKTNALPLSHPPYMHVAHEYVFWLAKSIDAYRGYDVDTRRPHSETSLRRVGQPYLRRKDERYAKRGKASELHPDGAKPMSVFACGVGSRRGVKHPAPMALPLARHLVSLSCPPGGLVFDPFCGSGTTGVAALERGRRFLGVDAHEPYVLEAREQIIAPAPLERVAAEVAA
jgi:DNA modification methylase